MNFGLRWFEEGSSKSELLLFNGWLTGYGCETFEALRARHEAEAGANSETMTYFSVGQALGFCVK